MSIKLQTRIVLRCKCSLCGHEWDALEKPRRCARCQRFRWNGEDRRRRDPMQFVPRGSRLPQGAAPPVIPHAALLEALEGSRYFLEQIIHDFGPCDHAKDQCVCEEQQVLAKVSKQIAALTEFTEESPAAVAATGD